MKIVIDRLPFEGYFDFVKGTYGVSLPVESFINDSRKGLAKVLSQKRSPSFFYAADGLDLIGQIALIPSNANFAFFGFFESINHQVFQSLWQALIQEAQKQGVETLFGPVNGTIWHPYRFVSKSYDEPFIPSEPISKPEYSNWFNELAPASVIEYHSAYRTDFSPIIESTKQSYVGAYENGISIGIEEVGLNNLRDLFDLANDTFSVNPGFVPLSFEEFVSLYSSEKLSSNKALLYTARYENKLVGFCLNLETAGTLIMKTIAVLGDWQRKGIGNAMVHKVHIDAIDKGISKVIYALVRKENNVKFFPTDKITIFREYKAYLFHIKS